MTGRPFTLVIHIALSIILAGASVTHFAGIQGKMSLQAGGAATDRFEVTAGPSDGILPFDVSLENVRTDFYPGTTTPLDYRSSLIIGGERIDISMNKIGESRGWRFYQVGIGKGTVTVSVCHDPCGIGISYAGYFLLFVGMAGFFFQKKTPWRTLLRLHRRSVAAILICLGSVSGIQAGELPSMQRPLARNLGKIYVLWNDRICPMQTMARDVTLSLYDAESYKGLSSEQVLSGWLFYFDEWYRDYLDVYPEAGRLPGNPLTKAYKKIVGRIGLIQWLGTGEAFRIYPYSAQPGNIEWLSLTERRPAEMDLEQWTLMQTAMPRIKELLLSGKNIKANVELDSLRARQVRYAGERFLPNQAKMEAERMYNVWARPAVAGIVAIVNGLVLLFMAVRPKHAKRTLMIIEGFSWLLLLYLAALMGVLWWIGGHIPLSNGPETMLFTGLAAITGANIVRKNLTVKGCLGIVGGLALLVSAMGGRVPRIGMLMPVLSSPLLSVHVLLVMLSYMLFMLMALLSAVALSASGAKRRESLSVLNRLILTPAVCLLGAGIFIGAVWANQTWGRYWGWDPKETCALVTWLVYAVPMHWGCRRLKCFRSPKILHIYLLSAILCVAFTYFGANYLLPGLHSYA